MAVFEFTSLACLQSTIHFKSGQFQRNIWCECLILNSNENLLTESSGLHYLLDWYLLLFKVYDVKVGYLRPRFRPFRGRGVVHHGCKEGDEYLFINLEGKNVTTYCAASINGGTCTSSGTTSSTYDIACRMP